MLPIRQIGDKILRQKAEPVNEITEEIIEFIQDLLFTMYETDGVGLAAPQVGRSQRIFIVDIEFNDSGERDPIVFINPVITESDGVFSQQEGCLSLPGVFETVKRSKRIAITGLDINGEPISFEASEFAAAVIQHEYDHLNGILFTDRLSKLKLIPLKKKLKELASSTDENGNNLRQDD
ncbi:MAG: peptide deformylase [Candidatus Cloacimonetes bacterium]|nr:peptide deformylase [Candidatus Cloacimonadota bacterium]